MIWVHIRNVSINIFVQNWRKSSQVYLQMFLFNKSSVTRITKFIGGFLYDLRTNFHGEGWKIILSIPCLMFCKLGKNFNKWHFAIVFIFPEMENRIWSDKISLNTRFSFLRQFTHKVKPYFMEYDKTICMKCQSLFSGENNIPHLFIPWPRTLCNNYSFSLFNTITWK